MFSKYFVPAEKCQNAGNGNEGISSGIRLSALLSDKRRIPLVDQARFAAFAAKYKAVSKVTTGRLLMWSDDSVLNKAFAITVVNCVADWAYLGCMIVLHFVDLEGTVGFKAMLDVMLLSTVSGIVGCKAISGVILLSTVPGTVGYSAVLRFVSVP